MCVYMYGGVGREGDATCLPEDVQEREDALGTLSQALPTYIAQE